MEEKLLKKLASKTSVGFLFDELEKWHPEFLYHWKQGEFHHDHVVELNNAPEEMPGNILVISTNCNGGVKEIICLNEIPERWALWNHRCPENSEFEGELSEILDIIRTHHWYDPCSLLTPDARSEYKPDHRRRQRGGGWVPIDSKEE